MSYHVAIVRTSQRGTANPIGHNEVRDLVAEREALTVVEERHGRLRIRGTAADLMLQDGEIWASNPDRGTLQLMLELAVELNGRVRGDELETYRTPDETFTHPDDVVAIRRAQREARSLRMRARMRGWMWMGGALGLGAMLGLLVEHCASR